MSNPTITPASAKIKKFEAAPVQAETEEQEAQRKHEEFVARAARKGHEFVVRLKMVEGGPTIELVSCSCGEMKPSSIDGQWGRHARQAMRPPVEARELTQRIQLPKEFVKSLGRK